MCSNRLELRPAMQAAGAGRNAELGHRNRGPPRNPALPPWPFAPPEQKCQVDWLSACHPQSSFPAGSELDREAPQTDGAPVALWQGDPSALSPHNTTVRGAQGSQAGADTTPRDCEHSRSLDKSSGVAEAAEQVNLQGAHQTQLAQCAALPPLLIPTTPQGR